MMRLRSFVLVAALLLVPTSGQAQVTKDHIGTEITTSTSPLSGSFTVNSGTNVAVIIPCAFNASPGTVTGTLGSSTVTEIVVGVANAYQARIYAVIGPSVGTQTLSMSWTTTTTHGYCDPVQFNGVNQTGGSTTFPTGDKTTDPTNSFTVTVTNVASGDGAVYAWAYDPGTLSSPTQQLIWTANHSQGYSAAGQYATGVTGTVSAGWGTNTSAFTSGAGIRIVGDGGGGGGSPKCQGTLGLTGVSSCGESFP